MALLEETYRLQQVENQRQELEKKQLEEFKSYTRTIEEFANAYLKALQNDPHITYLQILDMDQPMDIVAVYVRLLLHQDVKLGYNIDKNLIEAEQKRDPNELLLASQKRLESKIRSAIEPAIAIKMYTRCVIVGDPGAGKTTLLKYLTLMSIDKRLVGLPGIPIYVELNAFASSGLTDLLDYISSKWEEQYKFPKNYAHEYIEKNLKNRNALLLLDALDESMIGENVDVAEASYHRVVSAIKQVVTRYSQAHIVVTARKAGYHLRGRLIGFTELEILDFALDDIKKFIKNWFDYHSKPLKYISAEELIGKLEKNMRMQTLATNPLLLSLIVIVYESQLDLPELRSELYKQCVETLLSKWDSSRDIRRRRIFKSEHKRLLLEEIAWHFHSLGQRYFREEELLSVIAGFLPAIGLPPNQNREILEEIALENGLLKAQAQEWYGFLHLTMQEYFAAQYAADNANYLF